MQATRIKRLISIVSITVALLTVSCDQARVENPTITLSVVGTNDVHGALLPIDGNQGLALFAGYVDNLRETRAGDGGAVLLDGRPGSLHLFDIGGDDNGPDLVNVGLLPWT